MKKLNINLPKYRLHVEYRLIRRRKPLMEEPILPTIKEVKKKYRKGSLVSRYFRHIFEHKNINKALGINLVLIALMFLIIPSRMALAGEPDEAIIVPSVILNTSPSLQYPVQTIRITQRFSFFHPGLDLAGKAGDPIKPVKTGLVIAKQYLKYGYGNVVIIDHGNHLTSIYAHLSKIEVNISDEVDMNTEIGKMGATGNASGNHLHLEIRENGTPINPLLVLP